MKTRKILDICEHGKHIVCIKDDSAIRNPYRVYNTWYEAGSHHRKMIGKYANFDSVLMLLLREYGYRQVIL